MASERTFLDFIRSGGLWGSLIILLALVGIVLVLVCALTIRRGALLPPFLISRLEQATNSGDVDTARELCVKATALRNVVFAGLARLDAGPEAAARAAHLAAEKESLALKKRAGWFFMLAIAAGLVGALSAGSALMGSYGKLAAFSEAQVTGCAGLFVAVLLVPPWWFFSARAEMLAHELEMTAEDLISRVRSDDQAKTDPRERE